MKLQIILMAAMAAVSYSAESAPITPEQAFKAVEGRNIRHIAMAQEAKFELVSESDAGNQPATYTFSRPDGGFMVLAADDAVPSILLGYGDSGACDPRDMPPAMKAMIDLYTAQIGRMRQITPTSTLQQDDNRSDIEPLLSTKWGQGNPYNGMCPMDGNKRSVTGCVATAMAQVMNYHKWPQEYGVGAHSYRWHDTTLSIVFAQTKFDWDSMLNVYNGHSTARQNDAVALLMKACGYSVDMSYSSSSSGAVTAQVADALVDYFDYSPTITNIKRQIYSSEEFEDMVYQSLAECGPVIFSGHNNSEGHAFVCDGYRQGGYFHINWGWSGSCDGYFLLNAFNPHNEECEGSAEGYNFSQTAMINIRPRQEGEAPAGPKFMSPDCGFTILSTEIAKGANVSWKSSVSHSGGGTIYFSPVFKITDEDGNVCYSKDIYNMSLPETYYYGSLKMNASLPDNLPEGRYSVTGAVLLHDSKGIATGEYLDITYPVSYAYHAEMIVGPDSVKFENQKTGVPVLDDITVTPAVLQPGCDFHLSGHIDYPFDGEYYGSAYCFLVGEDGSEVRLDPVMVDVENEEEFNYEAKVPENLDGEYTLYIGTSKTDSSWHYVVRDAFNAPFEVEVSAPLELTVDSLSVDSDETQAAIGLPVVYANNVHVEANVTCHAGHLDEPLELIVRSHAVSGDAGQIVARVGSDDLDMSKGESGVASFRFAIPDAASGRLYSVSVAHDDEEFAPRAEFVVDSPYSLEDAIAVDGYDDAPYYTLSGVRVIPPLAPGIYIHSSSKILIH